MRDGVREGVWEFWTKCEGLRGVWVFRLVKRCVCTFFFFFEFRPDLAVSADTGLYGPSRPDLGRVGADFSRVGANFSRVGANFSRVALRRPDSGLATWHDAVRRSTDARSAASLPRPAASDAGALAWELHPCIPGLK